MNHETNVQKEIPHTSKDAATSLSQNMFSDPKEFLQVLKKNFDQIDKRDSSVEPHQRILTVDELTIYAKTTDDLVGKEAAKFALDHYDTLKWMDKISEKSYEGSSYGISNRDLNIGMDIYDKKLWPYIKQEITFPAVTASVLGLATAASAPVIVDSAAATAAAAGTELASSLAMGTIASGWIAVAGVMFTAYWGSKAYEAYNGVQDFAKRSQDKLAGPPEQRSPYV